jgi:hypothetical protein
MSAPRPHAHTVTFIVTTEGVVLLAARTASSRASGAVNAEPHVVVGRMENLAVEVAPAPRTDVHISLRRPSRPDPETLTLVGVSRLRLWQEISNWPLFFQIVDISDRGWKDIRYEITDPEFGILSRRCVDVRFGSDPDRE